MPTSFDRNDDFEICLRFSSASRIIAQIIVWHPFLYNNSTQKWTQFLPISQFLIFKLEFSTQPKLVQVS